MQDAIELNPAYVDVAIRAKTSCSAKVTDGRSAYRHHHREAL
jgi:hypothetical protein